MNEVLVQAIKWFKTSGPGFKVTHQYSATCGPLKYFKKPLRRMEASRASYICPLCHAYQ